MSGRDICCLRVTLAGERRAHPVLRRADGTLAGTLGRSYELQQASAGPWLLSTFHVHPLESPSVCSSFFNYNRHESLFAASIATSSLTSTANGNSGNQAGGLVISCMMIDLASSRSASGIQKTNSS